MAEVAPGDFPLFCFAYAGGSAQALYARWGRALPSWLSVTPIELPGRGSRMSEPLQTQFDALVASLTLEVQRQLSNVPFGFFGHSLGALLAFEVAHRLQALAGRAPLVLFASGANAPAVRDYTRYEKPLTDDALVAEMRRLNGTHDEVFAAPELLQLALPILRADFLLCGSYRYRRRSPLPTAIHVFAGDADQGCQSFMPWSAEAGRGFSHDVLAGDHFFIHGQQAEVLRRLERRVREALTFQGDRAWSAALQASAGLRGAP